jgi:hypothetical protein
MDDRRLLAKPTTNIDEEVARIADEFRAGFEHVARIDRPARPESATTIRRTRPRARPDGCSRSAAGR